MSERRRNLKRGVVHVPAKDQLAVLVESPVAMVVYNQQRLVVSKPQKLLHYHGQSLDRRVHGDQALVDLIAICRKRIVQAYRLFLEAHDEVAGDLVEAPGQVVEGPGQDEDVGGFVFSLGQIPVTKRPSPSSVSLSAPLGMACT